MNDEQLILSEKSYEYGKEHSFPDYIKRKRKLEKGKSGKNPLSTQELAKRVGIDYEMFRKILNMNKPTKKRDCIIAICAALRLDIDETNEALILYRYMPKLDSENERDDLLMDILEEQFDNPLSIEQINAKLVKYGFPELDIIDHRCSSKAPTSYNSLPYKVLKKEIKTFAEDLVWGDQYDSLSTQYSTFRYRCVANMWLDDTEDRLVYKLSASNDGNYYIEKHGQNIFDIRSFHSLEETQDFKDYFSDLDTIAKRERKKMLDTLDDTKNFQKRMSADVINGKFRLFAETFNYYLPELNEYLFLTWDDNDFHLYIYPKSMFMHMYLGNDEYQIVYGTDSIDFKAKYTFEELELAIASANPPQVYVLKHYKKVFESLKNDLIKLQGDLRERKKFVNNHDCIYEDDSVCKYYGVEKEFACSLDDDYGDYLSAHSSEHTFVLKSGESIIITLHELHRAFELGFNTIEEICQAKLNYNSIDEILNF